MTKRIVSGIFILTAIGALGVILAGALTSGEQLIVRFLTAVIVAALGLYVISDLRMQADDDGANINNRTGVHPRLAGIEAPPESTAAFMATVTRRSEIRGGQAGFQGNGEDERVELRDLGATSSSTSEQNESAVVEDAGSLELRADEAAQHWNTESGHDPETAVPETVVPETVVMDVFSQPRPGDESPEFDWSEKMASLSQAVGPAPETVVVESLNGHGVEARNGFSTLTGEHQGLRYDPPVHNVGGNQNGHSILNGSGHHGVDLSEDGAESSPTDLNGSSDSGAEDNGFEPVASAEFEYSGELETPDFAWPASSSDEGAETESPADALSIDASEIEHASQVEESSDFDESREVEAADSIDGHKSVIESAVSTTGVLAAALSESEFGPIEPPIEGSSADASDGSADGDALPLEATDLPGPPPDQQLTVEGDEHPPELVELNGSRRPLPSPVSNSIEAAEYAEAPLAPIIDLRQVVGGGQDIDVAIEAGELEVVSALIEQGLLSIDGPISDRDVRTMVYVAFTSNELRKLLLAGGRPDQPNPGIDLGPVELFDSSMVGPPKVLYSGLPAEPEAQSQLG